jgi:hypothetical protein
MHILVEGMVCGFGLFCALEYLNVFSPAIKKDESPLPYDFKTFVKGIEGRIEAATDPVVKARLQEHYDILSK